MKRDYQGKPAAVRSTLQRLVMLWPLGKNPEKEAELRALPTVTLSADELAGDVYFAFTTREEVGGFGAATSAFGIDPDYALVMDVTFSWVPEDKGKKWTQLGSGVAISMSAVTDRKLTKLMRDICLEEGIKHTLRAEPNNTGTDANRISNARAGIPTVLVSLPLRNMHTPIEVISLDDAQALTDVVRAFVTSRRISEVYSR